MPFRPRMILSFLLGQEVLPTDTSAARPYATEWTSKAGGSSSATYLSSLAPCSFMVTMQTSLRIVQPLRRSKVILPKAHIAFRFLFEISPATRESLGYEIARPVLYISGMNESSGPSRSPYSLLEGLNLRIANSHLDLSLTGRKLLFLCPYFLSSASPQSQLNMWAVKKVWSFGFPT